MKKVLANSEKPASRVSEAIENSAHDDVASKSSTLKNESLAEPAPQAIQQLDYSAPQRQGDDRGKPALVLHYDNASFC